MSLQEDILTILKTEGYPTNEVIIDAMNEFIAVIEDEAEGMDGEDIEDDED
ncbi:MAG: hypothetical protein HRU15_03260 [Planctomycetes bacterium]|nr:hypothetical protein [Planctomycetota bacterium]